ncbi:MAG TPA: transposase [Candidatus Mucispirillum faecigallinarum]|uniref:Mutator family transposase n=1 Tax=Candidatus Mucispirillum faecigallinarum TaxID=2838699 RepID=A0A9D2GRY4_9BACT|nr:transposase [Candidatus Mucispirillum faecigallinarum]
MNFEKQLKQFKESLNFPKNFGISDYNILIKEIKKIVLEKALNGELDYHLEEETNNNSRNRYSSKTIKTETGAIDISTPRDRNSTFEPVIVKNGQRKASILDDQILALYARGMSTRDIVSTFEEIYGIDVSPTLVSRVTENVMESILDWQNRPLDAVYPIIYLDCIVVKVNQDKRVINKSVYLVLTITMEGKKNFLVCG